jgi:hypothetical protein
VGVTIKKQFLEKESDLEYQPNREPIDSDHDDEEKQLIPKNSYLDEEEKEAVHSPFDKNREWVNLDKFDKQSAENFLIYETFEEQAERVRKSSKFGDLKTWRLAKIIIKSGDDLRQE